RATVYLYSTLFPYTTLFRSRRQFVDIAPNFPEECRYVLESLGKVYHNDATAREQALSALDRLRIHQEQSGPVMDQLHIWLEAQLDRKSTRLNSSHQIISYAV